MSKQWFALRAHPEREEKIKNSLEARVKAKGLDQLISQIIVPAETVSEVKQGESKITEQRMFPGYIFAEIETNSENELPESIWYVITETPGIGGFVGTSRTRPDPVDPDEIRKILAEMALHKNKPKPKVEFEPGDKVRVKEGMFENYDGSIISVDAVKWTLKVSLVVFDRPTEVEMEYSKVERI